MRGSEKSIWRGLKGAWERMAPSKKPWVLLGGGIWLLILGMWIGIHLAPKSHPDSGISALNPDFPPPWIQERDPGETRLLEGESVEEGIPDYGYPPLPILESTQAPDVNQSPWVDSLSNPLANLNFSLLDWGNEPKLPSSNPGTGGTPAPQGRDRGLPPIPNREVDPKWERLERTVQKLHELQYPPMDTVSEEGHQDRRPGIEVLVVEEARPVPKVGGFYRPSSPGEEGVAGFYSLSSTQDDFPSSGKNRSLLAEVYEDQRVVSGSWVGLRILVPLQVEDLHLPAGIRVFGRAVAQGDRLMLKLRSLRFGDQILSIGLEVYDQDGQKGFHVPERGEESKPLDPLATQRLDMTLRSRNSEMVNQGGGLLMRWLRPRKKPLRLDLPARYRVYLVNQSTSP